mmetsp:Transcript_32604/g.101096  ORF Transcript_32604/g.101096 Transcript_32604/m.101096 type:complete len:283 (+) Transcript_32604:1669-2517(+)
MDGAIAGLAPFLVSIAEQACVDQHQHEDAPDEEQWENNLGGEHRGRAQAPPEHLDPVPDAEALSHQNQAAQAVGELRGTEEEVPSRVAEGGAHAPRDLAAAVAVHLQRGQRHRQHGHGTPGGDPRRGDQSEGVIAYHDVVHAVLELVGDGMAVEAEQGERHPVQEPPDEPCLHADLHAAPFEEGAIDRGHNEEDYEGAGPDVRVAPHEEDNHQAIECAEGEEQDLVDEQQVLPEGLDIGEEAVVPLRAFDVAARRCRQVHVGAVRVAHGRPARPGGRGGVGG